MGAFYGSIQVRSDLRDAVVAAVEFVTKERGVKCLVSPVLNHWIGIYPENHGQDDQFGAAIARQLDNAVLQVIVHDSDVMAYWLWRDRKLVDSYWSAPGYFGEADRQHQEMAVGRPDLLASMFGTDPARVAKILRRTTSDPTFAEEQLERLAKLLGISNALTSYEYLKEGGVGERKGWRKFTEIPTEAPAPDQPKTPGARAKAKKELADLKKSGLLLLRDERKQDGTSSVDNYQEPWEGPAQWEVSSSSQITGIASDALHQRIAVSMGDRVRILNSNEGRWQTVAELQEHNGGALALSQDGQAIAYASRDATVVSRIAANEPLVRIPELKPRHMAFHPSGEWVAATGVSFGLICLHGEPHWRQLFVGGKLPSISLGSFLLPQLMNMSAADLQRQSREAMDSAMARMEKMVRRPQKPGKSTQAAEDVGRIDQVRVEMAKQMDQWVNNMLAIKEGREPQAPPQAKEHVNCVGFSRDGRWLWCGTSAGLRIYQWDSIPRQTGGSMPLPVWTFSFPGPVELDGSLYVYAIAEEADAPAIVFGGGNGRIYRLDVDSGDTRELVKLPGIATIHGLFMSGDGKTLGAAGSWAPQMPATYKDQRSTWDIWSYPRLRGMHLRR